MAERTDELNDYTRNTTGASSYPSDTLNRVGAPDVDDEMLDELDDTSADTIVVVEAEIVDTGEFTEAEIQQTRDQMGQTIDAIQDKLRPSTLAQQAKDAISDVAGHAKDTLSDVTQTAVNKVVDEAKGAYHGVVDPVKETVGNAVDSAKDATMSLYQVVRQNPIPLGMAAVGLFWLYRNMRGKPSYTGYNRTIFTPDANMEPTDPSMTDRISDKASLMKDQAGQVVSSIQDKASGLVDKAQDKFGQVSDKAQQTFGQVSDKAQQTFGVVSDKARQSVISGKESLQSAQQENPLMIGAVALLAGAMIGMMLPSTDVENRFMGESRDRFAGSVSDKAHDLKDKVGTVAQQVMTSAKDTAKQEAQNQGLMPQQGEDSQQQSPGASVNEVMGVG